MTSVNVASVTNTVTVAENNSSTVTAITQGPQGPAGPAGPGLVVNEAAKVDKSIVYYDSSSAQFKVDAVWTTNTLTDGGNF